MKEIQKQGQEPCNLVSAKLRRHSNIWDTFESPVFAIELFSERQTVEPILEEGSTENLKQPKSGSWRRYIGIFFAIMSSAILSLGPVTIKTLKSYHAFKLSIWRFQGVLIPSIFILAYNLGRGKKEIVKDVWPISNTGAKRNLLLLCTRGFISFVSIVAQNYSLQYLSIADSTVIIFSTPTVVTLLAYFVLGEPLGWVPIIISIFSFFGVVVITRPPLLTGEEFSMDTLIGIGMALTSMLTLCGSMTILRFLRDVHKTVVTTSFGCGAFYCLVLALGLGVFEFPQGRDDWIYAIALGTLTFVGQMFFVLALQYEKAGPVALVRTGDVIFAFIWQFLFFGTHPDMFSLIGALIIVSGVLLSGIRKLIDGLPEKNPTRQRLRYLLL